MEFSKEPGKGKSDRKGGLSCAECRRSKLKCDRAIPCSACVRRGCSAICPDGTLVATKGNKVLQTQNQALQQAVKSMNSRIRELEAALGATQSQISPQPHPLLAENSKLAEVDAIASLINDVDEVLPEEPEDEAAELIGAMSIGEQGQTRFHGVSTSSEYLQTLLPKPPGFTCTAFNSDHLRMLGLPEHILELAYAFPFNCITPKPRVRAYLHDCLPNHAKALELALLYFENIGYMADVITREDFIPKMLIEINKDITVVQNVHPHQLAVIFLVLAIGSTISDEASGSLTGQRYYALACASISLQPLVRESTNATLQALFIMMQYYGLVDRSVSDRRWLMSGIMIRLAHSMGLQRDPATWELSEEEVQLRRTLFWEMYSWDIWHSITLGRPPALDIRYTDCHFPEDRHPAVNTKGEKEWGFHSFRYRLHAFCLSQVSNHVFNARQQDYQQLLQLDMKLRKFQTPSALLCPTSGNGEPVDGKAWSPDSMEALQQYSCLSSRESILLYIHRRYFAGAIKLNREEPMKTKYGASVLATIRSACLLLSGLRSLYGKYPNPVRNQCYFWSGAFSACIVLGCLVHNCPDSSLAVQAMRALESGVELFSVFAQPRNGRKETLFYSYDLLARLLEKSRHTMVTKEVPEMSTDPECPIMRVLEGTKVLIKQPSFAACPSTPSTTNSGSPCSYSSSDHPTPPPTEPIPIHPNAPPGWTAERLPLPEIPSTDPVTNTLYDFSGVYYVPPNELPMHISDGPSIYKLPAQDIATDKSTLFDIFADGQAKTIGSTGTPSGPTVIQIPEYPTFTSAIPRQPHGSIQSEDVHMQAPPSTSVVNSQPQVTHANGLGETDVHQNGGYSINGLMMGVNAPSDQASWDSFLQELGIASGA